MVKNKKTQGEGEEILKAVSLQNIEIPGDKTTEVEDADAIKIPEVGTLEWSDYALSLFTAQELIDGKPTCDALRRVAEFVIGPIIGGCAKIVQSPNPSNEYTATVEYTVSFHDGQVWTSVADVNSNNCDPKFARFACAMAETRAEGRALRKALRLRKVISAEEPDDVYAEGNTVDNSKANSTQWLMIDNLCKRININVDKFLSEASGFKWTRKKEDVPYKSATIILSVLSDFQRNMSTIDPKFLGYDPDWKDEVK